MSIRGWDWVDLFYGTLIIALLLGMIILPFT